MKKKKYFIDASLFRELKSMGYTVVRLTFWHYRVMRIDDSKSLDIFPTTRVWTMHRFGHYVNKGEYKDMIELVETKLDDFAK